MTLKWGAVKENQGASKREICQGRLTNEGGM